MSKIIILNGGSGSGKSALANALKEYAQQDRLPFELIKAVTCCTRNPRIGETHGVDYYFMDEEQFLKDVKNGEFVEYSLYDGTYRGLRKDELEKCLQIENAIILLVMDINGVNAIKKSFGNAAKSVYINVPIDVLEQRMRNRKDKEEDIQSRLKFYETSNEKENKNLCDKVITNDSTIEKMVMEFITYAINIL